MEAEHAASEVMCGSNVNTGLLKLLKLGGGGGGGGGGGCGGVGVWGCEDLTQGRLRVVADSVQKTLHLCIQGLRDGSGGVTASSGVT
ncbi:hypothetical protein ACOSQ4_013239 [Xanthoceras sorbifolium]